MRNEEKWRSSKYIYEKGKLVASRDRKEVGIGSRLIANRVAELYDNNLTRHAKGRLLDLGCGNVPFYGAYRELVTDNICVDWKNTSHKNEYLDCEIDLTKRLPFRNNEFDTIILSDVLEHIPVPEDLWKEMARVLARSGSIMMNVPFYYWIHERPHDYYRYTEFALRRFVETSGLTLIASNSAVGGTIAIHQDAAIYFGRLRPSGGLDGTDTLEFRYRDSRGGWLQTITGDLDINGTRLGPGDGAAIENEADITVTGHNAEFLLFDLA